MADSSKKVEVRFGAFACTIEGYDDPVAQMREVLGMMQRMISETPALAEAAEFKAEDVEDALSDGENTPGVVVIRSADAPEKDLATETDLTTENASDQATDAADVQDATVVAEPEASPEAEPEGVVVEADPPAKTAVDTATDAVEDALEDAEEVAASAIDDTTDAAAEIASDVADKVSDTTKDVADVATGTADAVEQQIDDVTSAADDATEALAEETETNDPSVGSLSGVAATAAALGAGAVASEVLSDERQDDQAAEAAAPQEEPAASSTAAWLAERRAEAQATDAPDSEDETPAGLEDGDVAEVLETFVEPDPAAASPEPEVTHSEVAATDDTADDVPFNIFAAPPSPDPVEPLIQTAGSPPAKEEPLDRPIEIAETDDVIDAVVEEITPASDETQLTETETVEIVSNEVLSDSSEAAPAAAVNIFASEVTLQSTPEPEPEPELEAGPQPINMPPRVDPVNIFAQPDEISASTAEMNEAEPASIAPEPEQLLQHTTNSPAPEAASAPVAEAEASLGFNIFANPGATAPIDQEPEPEPIQTEQSVGFAPDPIPGQSAPPEPETILQPEPEPDPEPEPEKSTSSGAFSALLKRVQAGAMMGAPGEAETDQSPPVPQPPPDMSAADFVGKTQSTQVSDMLAGSAAWLTLVQNKSKFTRREVMEIFDTIPGDHPKTLEARIKGFGKLVRSGTLILIDDGVFAMAQNERERFQKYLN
ncbi:MAG: hypothetical protein AAF557_01330 [Pseudomonadota bacterium]